MAPSNCPRCNHPYTRGLTPHRLSKDHILPTSWGGRDKLYGDVRNTILMCQACNELRARAGHCWGMFACAQTVARSERVKVTTILIQWRVQARTMGIPKPPRIYVPAPVDDKPPPWEHNRGAVALGIAVSRAGADEFIFPADTSAKRVWNLATLARHGYKGPRPRDC